MGYVYHFWLFSRFKVECCQSRAWTHYMTSFLKTEDTVVNLKIIIFYGQFKCCSYPNSVQDLVFDVTKFVFKLVFSLNCVFLQIAVKPFVHFLLLLTHLMIHLITGSELPLLDILHTHISSHLHNTWIS